MLIFPFTEPAAQQVALSGGKGANLARLTALGFDVPPGLIVTAAAYRQFIAQAPWLAAEAAALDFTSAETLLAQTRALHSRLHALALPDELVTTLRSQLGQLPERVSVRSSATAEDTASAAFAGQHDTYLNVPRENIAERIKACWLSLWSDRALMYRRQVGVGVLDTSMAVVLQTMVQADVAGVAFSVDPVAGNLDCVIIDANYGLGESVVSGEAQVDHWQIDKQTGQTRLERLAEKHVKIVGEPGGGTVEVELHGAQRLAPVLDSAQLAQLLSLVQAIEKAYGFPQDIEWALAGGNFYVLQSRPITSIAPRWTRDESAEVDGSAGTVRRL
jgi:phosphoenolpyruvate synthase/pyruvate phosphate dikinase